MLPRMPRSSTPVPRTSSRLRSRSLRCVQVEVPTNSERTRSRTSSSGEADEPGRAGGRVRALDVGQDAGRRLGGGDHERHRIDRGAQRVFVHDRLCEVVVEVRVAEHRVDVEHLFVGHHVDATAAAHGAGRGFRQRVPRVGVVGAQEFGSGGSERHRAACRSSRRPASVSRPTANPRRGRRSARTARVGDALHESGALQRVAGHKRGDGQVVEQQIEEVGRGTRVRHRGERPRRGSPPRRSDRRAGRARARAARVISVRSSSVGARVASSVRWATTRAAPSDVGGEIAGPARDAARRRSARRDVRRRCCWCGGPSRARGRACSSRAAGARPRPRR